MVVNFKDAFDEQKDPNDKKLLRKLFKVWIRYEGEEGKRIVQNLLDECFLSREHMQALINFMVKLIKAQQSITRSTLLEVKKKLSQEFYKNLQLKGDTIKISNPKITGFIIPERRMKLFLLDGLQLNTNEVNLFVQDLVKGWVNEKHRSLCIRDPRFLIWCTWNKFDHGENPFVYQFGSKVNKKVVRILLGLGHPDYDSSRLIGVLIDNLSVQKKKGYLFRPTFCDANFDIFFKPGDPKIEPRFGLTKPLMDNFFHEGSNIPSEQQPEAVIRSRHIAYNDVREAKVFF